MPSVNILTDFLSVLQTTTRINQALSDFKVASDRICHLYDDDLPEAYLNAIDELFENLTYRDMFLIIGLLASEINLVRLLEKSEDKPSQIIEKLFLNP